MENLVDKLTLGSFYKGKKVFVTGHTGFKGSWLIAWLHTLEARVKGYALAPEYPGSLFSMLPCDPMIQSVIADIRDKAHLTREILDFQPDIVFHLAAQPLVRRSYQVPSETFEVNAVGTAHVLEAVNKLPGKCSVIIITTDKVYENKEQDILYRETDALGGYDPYSASKACAEIVVNSFRSSFFNIEKIGQHNKAIASVRAGNVIGGGDMSEDRIIPDIIRALKANRSIEVRNPVSVRPWQHVLEPLGGYLLLGSLLHNAPVEFSGAYNFGPALGDHLTVATLVNMAIAKWGSGEWVDKSDPNQVHEATLLKLDINKARQVLNWEPKLDAATAIDWTIEWYTRNDDAAAFTYKQIDDYMQL
jgi:CDP-glucose 4,6-dehydratase